MPIKKKAATSSDKDRKQVPDSGADKPSGRKKTQGKKLFPLVGIGASAGGLEAIQSFFEAVPDEIPDMAFVVISHLDPNHDSILPDLIQKYTRMGVLHAEDGMEIELHRVYVIPPDNVLTIKNGKLILSRFQPSSGPRAPINHFFRSLAEQWGEMAVGIILSGMGSDGAVGIQAIKNELGMVMVQTPESAKYDGMPQSVVNTALADYILPPGDMPERLSEYVNRGLNGAPVLTEKMSVDSLMRIHTVLLTKTGHDFSHYKESTVRRRIARRMNIHGIKRISEYLAFLQKDVNEAGFLIKELLISVTRFFRDPEAFEALKEKGFPKVFKKKARGDTLRVWVAGCATGEEAYSLAMVLQEYMETHRLRMTIQIFATDLDEDAIHRARAGIYDGDVSADVGPERLGTFFIKENNRYRVSPGIRETIVFAPQSIIKDPPFTKMDLICCRNFLIYLDAEIQKRVLPLFHYSLNPGGILFLGSSESIGHLTDFFYSVDSHWKIFQRKPGSHMDMKHEDFPLRIPPLTMIGKAPEQMKNLSILAERTLLDKHTPPAIIIDAQGNIRYIHGRVSKYLEHPKGQIDAYNAFEMAREGLKIHLIITMRKMRPDSDGIRKDVRIGQDGPALNVRVTISPMSKKEVAGLYVVLFEELPAESLHGGEQKAKKGSKTDPSSRIEELERELLATKESLITTVEELESSNEELRSSNEEYQSTNEELQSSNEELSSSKEELQSLNEELETVNTELHGKMKQVEKSYDEMSRTLNSLTIPIIFLDVNLCVRRFSSSAGLIADLIETDVGRPLKQLSCKVEGVDFEKEVRQVLNTMNRVKKQVRTREGKWYLMRIIPYHSEESLRPEVVLVFLDIEEMGNASIQLEESEAARRYMDGIVQTVREPLVVLDKNFEVISANESFYRIFLVSEQEVEGRSIFDLGNGQWNIPELRKQLEETLSEKESFEDYEMEHLFPGIGKKKMRLNARRIHEGRVTKERILLAIEDVTERCKLKANKGPHD